MRTTLRRLAVTSAATLVVSGLAVPLASTPAHAAVAVERLWTIVDTDDDGSFGLARTDTPGGTPTVVEENAGVDYSDLTASADGSRVVYLRSNGTTDYLQVRDTGGALVRTVAALATDGTTFFVEPHLSPNGSTVAWTEVVLSDTGLSLRTRRAAVASGAPATVISGYGALGFLDNSTLLVQSMAGANRTVPVAGGATAAFPGLPADGWRVTVSPDSSKIAWFVDTTGTGNDTGDIHVGSLVNSSGSWSVSGDSTVATGLYNDQPAFSRDGATLYWTKYDGDVGPGDVWSRPVDLSAPAAQLSTSGDEYDVAVTALPDAVAPAAATALPATLNGTTPVLRWTNPADADLSGVVVSRPGRTALVPAPLTSFTDSGLVLGQTYTYTFTAVDRSGNQATGVTRQLTAIKPGAYFGTPTSQYSTKASFPVRFATGALADTTFFVDYLPYGGTLKSWVNGATGNIRTFGVAGTTNVAGTTAIVGGTYRFRVKVVDGFGNASAYVSSGKAVVPFDQTKATFSGGTNVSSGGAYLGSFRQLKTTASYARVALVGNKLMIVGWKCKTCGKFALYDGSTRIAVVDTYAASTQPRVLLFSKTYASSATHTFTIRPLGTAGRPGVNLDGFAMQR